MCLNIYTNIVPQIHVCLDTLSDLSNLGDLSDLGGFSDLSDLSFVTALTQTGSTLSCTKSQEYCVRHLLFHLITLGSIPSIYFIEKGHHVGPKWTTKGSKFVMLMIQLTNLSKSSINNTNIS